MNLLLFMLILVSISACGTNFNQASGSTFNNETTGNGIGSVNQPGPTSQGHSESIVVANGLAYIGSDNGTLYALGARDGYELWHSPLMATDGLANSNVVGQNGIIYIGTGPGSVYAFRAVTGVRLWHVPQSYGIGPGFVPGIVSISMMNNIIFAGNSQGVDAYRDVDGKKVWQYKQKPNPGPFQLQVVVVDEVVYFADNIGHIVALRATGGTQLWEHDANNGKQVWLRSITGSSEYSDAGPPEIVGEGIVFVGSVDGGVQAIQVNDGKLLWRYVIKK